MLLVPREAVLTDKGESVVYVAGTSSGGGPVAERRVVELGFTDELRAQIVSGVSVGEAVVVRGQRSLKHGSALKILPAEAPVVAGAGAEVR